MRGRVGLFYAKLMDVMECVAKDAEEYAQKAVAIASNSVLREGIQTKILANNRILFENAQSIEAGVDFFRRVSTSPV
jgi:predicted O-linked N-acetylglucosamine transferase (SPINDLY family)